MPHTPAQAHLIATELLHAAHRALNENNPLAAAEAAADAARTARTLEHHAVTQARTNGASWADIGRALHITRQAAQQRHGA